ncbi:MAG TPA: DUF3320 domain-containing protein [Armatimonadota bacterium]|nr:DUF3320 domain-containing protein [Armatimonadota bacterium]
MIEDLESILDDCLAIRMPEERLCWHYRSRHESLIAFSNFQYYDNKLLTFPSPDDMTPAVRVIPVDGAYDRGKSKQNRAEAEAVVKEIVRRLHDQQLCKRTIGVVTFSQVQQNLIQDLLDEQQRQDPSLEPYFASDAQEPVFVKNLENVQGDERDVILFSIGYGPDAQGRLYYNFGPLNRDGGWRRLNVAVSRARQEMMIFSTLRADQLDLSRTNAQGVRNLKAFLEYAERGKRALSIQTTVSSTDNCESIFEEQVCNILRERGHEVHTQVGCSGYRIDLAVVDPQHHGCYLLGIECDGATYHSAKTARDRDKLREMVLRQLGWQIHRIWSTDWWENPEREVERIEEAIARAKTAPVPVEQPAVTEQTPTATPIAKAVIAAAPVTATRQAVTVAVPYKSCQLDKVKKNQEDFYLPSTDSLLMEQISQIVSVEGPVSFNVIGRSVVHAWAMTRIGGRIEVRLHELCAHMNLTTTQVGTVTFYWPKGCKPDTYAQYRTPGADKLDRRAPEDIPPEEIACAALEVVRTQISLPEADLIRETAHLFGFQRIGPTVEQCCQQGVRILVQRGNVNRESDGRIVHVTG